MRKQILLTMLLLVLVIPSAALAAIDNTSHDIARLDSSLTEAGKCSACHVPHAAAAGGARLFPDAGTTLTDVGVIGNLCGLCHHTGGTYGGTTLAQATAPADAFVYGSNSHGTMMSLTRYPDGDVAILTAGTLPYVSVATGKTMECTSCHDVHSDTGTARPFLRTNMDGLCGQCHALRHYVSGTDTRDGSTGSWTPGATGSSNPGSHPSGEDVINAMGNPVQVSIPLATFNMARNANTDGWILGPHLTDTGSGVTCVTCHAVHGTQDDPQYTAGGTVPVADVAPNVNMLAIGQGTTSTVTYTLPVALSAVRDVAAGYGTGTNPLCTACHSTALIDGTPYTLNGAAVTPGANNNTHPLMGINPTRDDWVTAFPTFWPTGNTGTYATGETPVAICESCHVVHPKANANASVQRDDIVYNGAAATYGYILRDSNLNICGRCHTGAATAHHPVDITFDGTSAGLTNTGTATDYLSCKTCHTNMTAHNWTAATQATAALDASWDPADNGRNTTASVDAENATMSQTCMDCHFSFDGDASTYSPSIDGTIAGEAEYTNLGDGTHFMGNTLSTAAALVTEFVPQLAGVFTPGTTWSGIEGAHATNPGWSRFRTYAGSQVGIVCESCHELEPGKNNGAGGHLLLANFTEGQNGDELSGGSDDGHDDFCEACHLPAGTHPLSGDFVGRSGQNLATSGRSWLVSNISGEPVTWNAGGAGVGDLSCDSCHQVHNANTNSANFILEAVDGDIGVIPATMATVVDANNLVPNIPDGADNKGGDHQAFCQYCHAY